MMENVRTREKVDMVSSEEKYNKLVRRHNFSGRRIISENCVLLKTEVIKVEFCKPIYVGACILDLAK